jgi:hypothetical protein
VKVSRSCVGCILTPESLPTRQLLVEQHLFTSSADGCSHVLYWKGQRVLGLCCMRGCTPSRQYRGDVSKNGKIFASGWRVLRMPFSMLQIMTVL